MLRYLLCSVFLLLSPSFVTPQSSTTSAQTTINAVVSKYYINTHSVSSVSSKEIIHKENLGVLTVSSTLLLSNCNSGKRNLLRAGIVSDVSRVHGFEVTTGTAVFPNVTVSCDLMIKRSGIQWKSRVSAETLNVTIELTIVRNIDLNQYSIKPRLVLEPHIRLYVDDRNVFWFVRKYHLHDVSTYLSQEINGFFNYNVPERMNVVAKAMSK